MHTETVYNQNGTKQCVPYQGVDQLGCDGRTNHTTIVRDITSGVLAVQQETGLNEVAPECVDESDGVVILAIKTRNNQGRWETKMLQRPLDGE